MEEHIRILCVDDEQNVLKSLERFFIDDNYEILCAASGEEGLEIMQKVSPVQIVISDYRMPGMNGVEFLKEVCSRWPNTVRIVLSGYADTSAVVSAINEGQIYKFIPKPWDEHELRVAISNSIDRYILYKKNLQLIGELKILKDILDELPVGILCLDQDGLIILVNKKVNGLFGEENRIISGTSNKAVLSEDIQSAINKVTKNKSEISGTVLINNRKVGFKASSLVFPDERSGIILLFNAEDRVA